MLWSCGEKTRGQTLASSAVSEEAFATDNVTYGQGGQFHTVIAGAATSATAMNNPELQLLGGNLAIASLPWNTSFIDNGAPNGTSQPSAGPGSHLGGIADGATDWSAEWTYGIHPNNRAQPLWFETR